MRPPHHRLAAILALTVALVAAGCSGTTTSPTESDPLTVLMTNFVSTGPFHIMQEQSLLEQHGGLQVEWQDAAGGFDAVPALGAGDLDVWIGSPSPAFYALISGDVPVRIVADKGHNGSDCAFQSFLRRTDEAAGSTEDVLAGARVGVAARSLTGQRYLDIVLDEAGMSRDDLEVVDVNFTVAAEAVASGQIDLGYAFEPFLTQALSDPELGEQVELWKPSQEVFPGSQAAVIAYGPRLVEDEPELGEQFMAAYLEAVDQFNEGPTEQNLEILSASTGLERSVLTEMCWPSIRDDGQVNTESLIADQQWSVDNGQQDAVVPVEEFWEPRFVDAAGGDA